jgi:Resolvase, N terminal domain
MGDTFREATMRQAIGYIRVSTAKQGKSGLGLEAQKEALRRFAEAEGFAFAETFTEVETGSDDPRPELGKALERARKAKAPIIVAKLDRHVVWSTGCRVAAAWWSRRCKFLTRGSSRRPLSGWRKAVCLRGCICS